jgi:Bacterial Ig-like domain (group 1)
MERLETRTRGRFARWALLAFTLVAVFGTIGVGTASAAAPKALILGPTVSGSPSLEESQAVLDGFDVTVVDGTTWDTMTAAQFAAYQVLIIGDPTCGDTTSPGTPAANNMAVWQPVVMGSGGNKVIIGTDPVYHHFSHPGATTLIRNGIAFAGAVAGGTGAYVDISCISDYTDLGTPYTFLDGLTTHAAGSFTTEYPPCAGAISIVAQSGPTSGLHDSDLSSWGCSVHQSFKTWASDYTPLAIATDATLKPYCATDVDTSASVCGEPYVLISGGGVVIKSSISLTPADATNPVGTSHTVTATIVDGTGAPVSGKVVTFTVESGPNAGMTGTGTTGADGKTTFTYTDTGGAGMDSISAVFTNDAGGQEKATATKTWSTGTEEAPMCMLTATISGPPKQIQITISSGVGLGSVVVDTSANATTVVPPFTVGTTAAIVVTSTKTDQTMGSQVAITVTSTAGTVTKCDPVWPGKKAAVHKKLAKKAPARARHFNRNSR